MISPRRPAATLIEDDVTRDEAVLRGFLDAALQYLGEAEAALTGLESGAAPGPRIARCVQALERLRREAQFVGALRAERLVRELVALLARAGEGRPSSLRQTGALALDACACLRALVAMVPDQSDGLPQDTPAGYERLLVRLREAVEQQGETKRRPRRRDSPSGASTQPPPADLEAQTRALRDQAAREQGDSLTVPRARVDELTAAVERLSWIVADVRAPHPIGAEALAELQRITARLEEIASALRRAPLRLLFRKMARLVSDLGRRMDKLMHCRTHGERLEVERSVFRMFAVVLPHLVHNAVLHGIEPPAERAASGKWREGAVTLRAYAANDRLLVEVEDDGRGIEPERIRRVAEARGLVPRSGLAPGRGAVDLIFAPGFTTAPPACRRGARGVGLDVVRRAVEAEGGTIEVRSAPGRGTLFTVALPLASPPGAAGHGPLSPGAPAGRRGGGNTGGGNGRTGLVRKRARERK